MKQATELKRQRVGAGIALVALSAVIIGTVVAFPAQSGTTVKTTGTTVQKTTTASNNSQSGGGTYKDGMYAATGTYSSPGGKESIKVSVTLANNVITATEAESGANDPTATSYQSIFISGFKSQVVGKKIDSIKLKNVSGSSLTSQGFNNALQQIEQQAKA